MAEELDLKFASIDELYLDPRNPRIGPHRMGVNVSQAEVLRLMRSWALEELALSYLESGGYWLHEALLVVEEELYGKPRLVVLSGNRRLAALIYLRDAYKGSSVSQKWQQIVDDFPNPPANLFSRVPYLLVGSREEIQAFLGFRHVTGIKQWDAEEKAAFIAMLIDEQGMTYEQVMRRIGSIISSVRQNYIAYRVLLQIEESVEGFSPEWAERRFPLLYMSLRTEGARQYLQIDMMADPEAAKRPVPEDHLQNLANFSHWLFGTDDKLPLVTDTRMVNDFSTILKSEEAVEYLERTSNPNFEVAFRVAGGDEAEIVGYIEEAANNLELALSRAHLYKGSTELQKAVRRFGADALQLFSVFPKIHEDLLEEQD